MRRVLAATTMSLHHKLCHTLGGTLDLPHAQTHTVVLPHALAYNQPAAPDAVAALSRALGGTSDPARELWTPAGWAPPLLPELGMAEEDIPRMHGVQVVAAADDDPRLKYFTDKYDLAPVTTDEILADERITAVMVHSKSKDMVPLALRVLDAGKAVLVEKPGGAALADIRHSPRRPRRPGRSRRSATTCASPSP